MNVDLKHSVIEGTNNLLTWRNRYSKTDYPEKVVLNIFYRKYTIHFMFSEIIGYFDKSLFGKPKVKWNDFNEGFKTLKENYGKIAVSNTQPKLINLLSDSHRKVGNTNYAAFTPLISEALKGNKSKLEEIEYAYMYYLLTDECVLLWAALGGMGLSKIEAFGKLTGLIIEVEDVNLYEQVEQILGQLCAAPYLKENYKALPPNG